ncbi:MAG: ATP-binding protein [Bacteroidetes bacterium]|nr:ATP-binding protein [Bacteroidota bacterium]
MILESTIQKVIDQQLERIQVKDIGLQREHQPDLKSLDSHALIISGIRRCGKSTLLLQIIDKRKKDRSLYLNFESPLLYNFGINDFSRLDRIISMMKPGILFFDELQIVSGWELYVRQKLDEGYKVIITGSNASLLSQELGTKLTGRHITKELFPFSYNEFIAFLKLDRSEASLSDYMQKGGFPEFLKSGDTEQLSTLFNDILIRDIASRYNVRDVKSLYRLAIFLFSNIGNRITASKLKQPLAIGATSTIMSWFSYLESSYLVSFVPMYSTSTKAQLVNPRKVYSIDTGLANTISNTSTADFGRRLENLIFLHLRKHYKEIYYYDNRGECDFICFKNHAVSECIQVCYELTPDNLEREVTGLIKALSAFDQKTGKIITFGLSDKIHKDGYDIEVIPAWKFLAD